ncbi:MAG: glycosyltransferase family 2 protein [bacterium]|nr:glycosyltransferase family 2 protein [bacterium]
MKISGFTFVRNGIKFDYPFVESINSILPICDEYIVNVGKSDDNTLEAVKNICSDKIKIVESVWDESLREGGKILAQQTDIALSHCTGDWCFYLQGDEIVHEKYLEIIKKTIQAHHSNDRVEGLLFKYKHFYATYNYVGASRRWYRQEIRVLRNIPGVYSYKDAQGFRIDDRKLRVKAVDAYIYHYGWVKPPKIQQDKYKSFIKHWLPDSDVKKRAGSVEEFDYSKIDALEPFTDSHPELMKKRVKDQDWEFDYDPSKILRNTPLKHRILNKFENLTGHRIGEYKNFKLI